MRRPKLTYYLRWGPDAPLHRVRSRKWARLGFTFYRGKKYLGFILAQGWEGDKFVLDMG